MAQVDVGLPIPLGNYSYLPPVQTGINDAVEEQAMNPLLAWLAGQGIDLAAEKTGIKDVLRERGAGILDMIIPQAQAAETPAMPPVQTGFQPTTSVVAQDATGYEGFGPGGEFAMAPNVAVSTPEPLSAPQQDNMLNPQPIREDQSGLMRSPLTEWAMADSTAPVTDPEIDKAIKEAPKDSMLGRLWDSTLGDEEWRLRKAMILNSMRLNPDAALTQAFASRIKDLRETRGASRTIQWLRSQGYDNYADLGEQYPEILKDIVSSIATAGIKSPSAAESKISRIQELTNPRTGQPYSRAEAIQLADLTEFVRDPDTGGFRLMSKAEYGFGPTAQVPQSPQSGFQQRALPEGVQIETPAQTLERADIRGAIGIPGFISEVVNLPFELVGADRPMDEQARARTYIDGLTNQTMLALSAAFPGKPSNLTREKIEELTVQVDDIAQGPQKALDKQGNLLRTIYNAMDSAKYVAESGQGFDAAQRNAAREKYNELVPLYDQHVALYNKLLEAQSGSGRKAGEPVISPDVGSLLEKYQ